MPSGCAGRPSNRFEVSGKVTFDGRPIPAGRIYFNPDLARGNDGPQGYADIRAGHFDTRQGGKGAPAGAVIVRIEGFDGKGGAKSFGKPLFVAYQIEVELPREPCTRAFEVPASAARNLPRDTAPPP
jgi:hypothetical protein